MIFSFLPVVPLFWLVSVFTGAKQQQKRAKRLFKFLLWSEIACMTTFAFTAVDSTRVKSSVTSEEMNRSVMTRSNDSCPYLRQITLSQLYFWANIRRVGSMVPPRRPVTQNQVNIERNAKRATYVRLNVRCSPFEYCSRTRYGHL